MQVVSHWLWYKCFSQRMYDTISVWSLKYLITFWFLIFAGTTLSKLTFTLFDFACTGAYTSETYTVGACSTGGVKYQIVPGTSGFVPSLAPTTLPLESGYSVVAQYTDPSCTVFKSAVSHPLNSCNEYTSTLGVSGYVKYTTTAYAIARTEYSDASCTTAVSILGPTYTDFTGTCKSVNTGILSFPSLISVNSNGVPPSSLTMASIRFVPIYHSLWLAIHFKLYFRFLVFSLSLIWYYATLNRIALYRTILRYTLS